ncbi:MAG: hypothetical protein ABJE10_21965 [bacterium]
MRYTLWSHGQLIGDTELGFPRILDEFRTGWFFPNADGERLMPVFEAVSPAVHAFAKIEPSDDDDKLLAQLELKGSALWADLAEAFHRIGSLNLEMRREDGSVVPTLDIGIQAQPAPERSRIERYQIHVELADGRVIP